MLKWWQPSDAGVEEQDTNISKAAITSRFADIKPSKCVPVDIAAFYNDSVSNIFRNRYESPRPDVTTLQIPVQGIGELQPILMTQVCADFLLMEMVRYIC